MPLPLDTILNSLEDAVLCLDDQRTVAWLNDAAARMFGCDRAQTVGRPAEQSAQLAGLVPQLNLDDLGPVLPPASAGPAVRRIQFQPPLSTESVPLEAVVSQVVQDGRTIFTAVFRDISLLLRMEQAVYEARKTQALAALAGGIAHDFNNILTAVISQIDLAIHAPEFPATLRDHLIYAQTSARRGAELVSRLDTFGRQTKPEFGALDLAAVVDQTVFMLRRSLDPKIAIVCLPPKETPWLAWADSRQIAQALLNLAINARDAMPDGGKLTFQLANVTVARSETQPRKPGEFVRISVTDTGYGMPPEVAARILEPYFTTKDRSRGRGLGLSITAAVVAEHAGWIEVASQPEAGSRFSLFLPRSRETASTSAPVQVLDPKATEGKECLLIVDDEELVRLVTKAVLAYRGYKVIEAEDGQDAVDKYAANPGLFDLILMDMHMPRMNGYDALQRIRQLNPQAKVILLSGGVHDPQAGLADLPGVQFLHKPFENQELVRLVRQMLDSPKIRV